MQPTRHIQNRFRQLLRLMGWHAVPLSSKVNLLSFVSGGRALVREGAVSYQGVFTRRDMGALYEPPFAAAYDRGADQDPSLVDDPETRESIRLKVYYPVMFSRHAVTLEGDFLAVGISYGVAARTMVECLGPEALLGRRLWLVDAWAGTREEGGAIKDDYCTDVTFIQKSFAAWPNVQVIQGYAPMAFERVESERFAFVHLNTGDARAHASCFGYCWRRLTPGGVMVIDGYGKNSASRKLLDDQAAAAGAFIITMVTGQGLLLKPAVQR